jgi:hypothetical protein
MGVTTTPLGFKKPDGNELVRSGDNVIADNAQTAQDLLGPALPKIAALERAAFEAGSIPLIEDPEDPGFYILASPE